MKKIAYRKLHRYKYQLMKEYRFKLGFRGSEASMTFIHLYVGGELVIDPGYSWDGPSGPTIDTKTFMRGSLVHDAVYQLLRAGLFGDHEHWREIADDLIRIICVKDGMMRMRACCRRRQVRYNPLL